jgi:RNA polymerase sigma-70 factor (ECF subfamily)
MPTPHTDPTRHSLGDEPADDAFLRLMLQHQPLLFVYLRTMLNNSADAEEVLQETYISLWRKRRQFTIGTRFMSWAATVGRYEVHRFRRMQKNIPQILSDDRLLQMSSEMIAEYDLVEARHEALELCLQSLNERDRHFVDAAYSIKTTKKALGTCFGMTPDGFRKAVHRIRQKLLKCIQLRLRAEGYS